MPAKILLSSLLGISFCALSALSLPALAQSSMSPDEDSDYIGYDSIVEDLQRKTRLNEHEARKAEARAPSGRSTLSNSNFATNDPFQNVWIHAGVGFVQMTQNISLPSGDSAHMAGRGVQATLGIDILGPSFAAEGSVRSFSEAGSGESDTTKIGLKEFDLKLLLKSRRAGFGLRAGAGLSARYMTIRTPTKTFEETTPASVLTVGGDLYITRGLSLGLDLSARTAMISDTLDRASYDGTIRLDTHF
ncbi:MAG: hypothetical protein RBT63_03725 [Bdellovibrionales bacterium]|jgi:hypothetical protein|nr:hypothetical protein [Bdellovibrionales bacterium]